MRIWELDSDEQSRILTIDDTKLNGAKHPLLSHFLGDSKKDIWTPCPLIDYRKGKYIDFPYIKSAVPVFSRSTYDKIGLFIQDQVEFLPALHAEGEFFILNVMNVLESPEFEPSSSPSYLNRKMKFDIKKIPEGTLIFKIPELIATRVYVTDAFVSLVRQHKLKGFQFTEVWDSEFTEEMERERQRKYQATLEAIEQNKGPECTYEEAVRQVRSGKAMASGKWKMQQDAKGRLWLGQLGEDAEYHWLMPTFIPPVLLEYMWHEVERSSI